MVAAPAEPPPQRTNDAFRAREHRDGRRARALRRHLHRRGELLHAFDRCRDRRGSAGARASSGTVLELPARAGARPGERTQDLSSVGVTGSTSAGLLAADLPLAAPSFEGAGIDTGRGALRSRCPAAPESGGLQCLVKNRSPPQNLRRFLPARVSCTRGSSPSGTTASRSCRRSRSPWAPGSCGPSSGPTARASRPSSARPSGSPIPSAAPSNAGRASASLTFRSSPPSTPSSRSRSSTSCSWACRGPAT